MTSRLTVTDAHQQTTTAAPRAPRSRLAEAEDALLELERDLRPRPPWHKLRKSYRFIDKRAFTQAMRLATSEKPPGKSRSLSRLARSFFAVLQLEARLRTILKDHNYRRSIEFGVLRLHPANHLPETNLEEFQVFVREGLLQVGSCGNGDPIVVDLLTGSTGFLEHSEVWGDEPGCIFREHWFDTGLDLGTFLLAGVRAHAETLRGQDWAFPIDFYSAGNLGRRKVRAAARRLTRKR